MTKRDRDVMLLAMQSMLDLANKMALLNDYGGEWGHRAMKVLLDMNDFLINWREGKYAGL